MTEKQNKDIAILCFQNICNLTDIEFEYESEEDKKMIIETIQATISVVRKKQHEATKSACEENARVRFESTKGDNYTAKIGNFPTLETRIEVLCDSASILETNMPDID